MPATIDEKATSIVIHERLSDGSAPKRFCCDLTPHVEVQPLSSTTSVAMTTTVEPTTTPSTTVEVSPTTSTPSPTTTTAIASQELLRCDSFVSITDSGDGFSASGSISVQYTKDNEIFAKFVDVSVLNNGDDAVGTFMGHAHVDVCATGGGVHWKADENGPVNLIVCFFFKKK